MKKTLVALICTVLLATGGSALAYTLSDGTDVGDLDTYVDKTNLDDNGEATELAWVNSVLLVSGVTFEGKLENMSGWQTTQTANIYALYLGLQPLDYDYFLVKLGNNSTGYTDYFFENNDERSWAVLDLTTALAIGNDSGKISHISLFNVDSTPVPEPSTLLMLGAGLLGLGLYGRRRVQK